MKVFAFLLMCVIAFIVGAIIHVILYPYIGDFVLLAAAAGGVAVGFIFQPFLNNN